MRFILPYHLGCGNRGCEGICRGISNIFQLQTSNMILFNMSYDEYRDDIRLGLSHIGELRFKGSMFFENKRFLCKILNKAGYDKPYRRLLANFYLQDATSEDIVLMTGGDIYCYKNGHILPNIIVEAAKKKCVKTVLYCASFEEKFLTEEVLCGLENYDLIITRESLSSGILKRKGFDNIIIPDPAFSLEPHPVELPSYFSEKPIVGINFSPYTDSSAIFRKNIVTLLNYILEKDMGVCLIPHVFWKGQDDRISMKDFESFLGADVHILDSKKLNYLQIRYIISKCKYFIGGRTHSVISAYSTHVPCIALGYSTKAKGIAKDVGMPSYTIIDCKNLTEKEELLNAFKKLELNLNDITGIYANMDSYRKQSLNAKEVVLRL